MDIGAGTLKRGFGMWQLRSALVLAAGLGVLGTVGPALAADCKAPLTGRSRSDDLSGDRERLRLAREGAIAHWRQLARHTYGWNYRYWTAAQNKRVTCTGSTTRVCAVTARPCRTMS